MDRNIIVITSIIAILTLVFIYFSLKADNLVYIYPNQSNKCPTQQCPTQEYSQEVVVEEKPVYLQPSHPTVSNIPPDAIRQYDYSKLNDPFTEPTRRVARHDIPPYFMKQMIDLPTRGYPDNFTLYGVLTRLDKKKGSEKYEDNQIIRLFGRQIYPGSHKYEYYTTVNSGHDQIKIPLNTRRRDELYDGDKIRIEELHGRYEVKLHKYDAPKYYPDILY